MIGYYVHHQGRGHLQRMLSISARLKRPMTVLSSLPPTGRRSWTELPLDNLAASPTGSRSWIELPLDNLAASPIDARAGGTLHWAPRHDHGLRRRMSVMAGWAGANDPDLVVVDVSVEAATLFRLLGVPTVVVAMRGDRLDRAHRLAYDAADALLAPWAPEFADLGWPSGWLEKTFYAGSISRFDDLVPLERQSHGGPVRVAVLWGAGGGPIDPHMIAGASSVPGSTWRFAGVGDRHVTGVWELLAWADVVVTHGGQNAVAEVAAARRPAVVIADHRPHGEQLATVERLGDANLAVALRQWPELRDWPAILSAAMDLGGQEWSRWTLGNGAENAAGFIDATASQLRAQTAAVAQ